MPKFYYKALDRQANKAIHDSMEGISELDVEHALLMSGLQPIWIIEDDHEHTGEGVVVGTIKAPLTYRIGVFGNACCAAASTLFTISLVYALAYLFASDGCNLYEALGNYWWSGITLTIIFIAWVAVFGLSLVLCVATWEFLSEIISVRRKR